MSNLWYRANSRTFRPWLLLWLLPYLVISLTGESLHTHALNGAQSVTWSCAGAGRGQVRAPLAAHASDETTCLICQWTAQSTGLLAARMALPQPHVVTHAGTFSVDPYHPLYSRGFQSRGPPAL